MRANIVLTLTGKDRIGIVEEITEVLLKQGGNVENSRMARLGGEFAVLMLVSLPAEHVDGLEKSLAALTAQGYKVTTSRTEDAPAGGGRSHYQLEVVGADHEGIIHEIAQSLSQRSINIESMETTIRRAPITGSPLFSMVAQVAVPSGSGSEDWRTALDETSHRLNVEVAIKPAKSS